VFKNLLLFENFLLSHKCWLHHVKHVEDVMLTQNLQMAVGMSVIFIL